MDHVSQAVALADRPIGHALVLGGSGFLGAPLVRALVAAGIRTTCLTHRHAPPERAVHQLKGSIDTFRWRSLEADPPDVIFHLARIPRRRRFDGLAIRARNYAASARLLLWLASCPRPPLLVFVGGTLAYGSHGEALVTEETPLSPTSFSRNYHAAERPWLEVLAGRDAPVIVARPAWVLGAGSWFEAYFARPMREEGAVPVYGDGASWMSIVHVEDCAGLLIHIARRAPLMSAVNVFSGAPLRQRDLSGLLARASGLPLRPVSLDSLEARHGTAVREAFAFSARVGTVHTTLHAAYAPLHAELQADLPVLLAAHGVSAGAEGVKQVLAGGPERSAVEDPVA